MSKQVLMAHGGLARIIATGQAPAINHSVYHANTLTNLVGDLYAGLDVVSRELVGFIPSATRNVAAERAAVGQAVVWSVTSQQSARDVVPAMAIPEPRDRVVLPRELKITKSKTVEFGWTGEEQVSLNNAGPGVLTVQGDWFAQALRTLTNEIELDGAIEANLNASRATGTAGVTPFATTLGDTAQLRKILADNGAPMSEMSVVLDTTAGANLRTLAQLTKANEAGTTMTLRDGELLNLHGFSIKESAGVVAFTKGTAAGATTTAIGHPIGSVSINLAAAGTGIVKAGDTVTFAGDPNKYNVIVGDADVSNGGMITLAAPGLRQAIPAAATAITVGASYIGNVGFTRSALHLVARPPALPQGGDAAVDSMFLTDPRSGMVYEVRLYAGYRKMMAEVGCAWGWRAAKEEHIARLLG
jgi:plastocyanin